ncbi:hypothetical protein [uncultured Pseudoflavonifractor sp.]|uniref:hypothetical protein n=1 Tax=uncultured Pseudoflavonifractor sp. TaxID=1221379 RepID=UPI0025E1BB51|nr:hypothetical protein [uncultured Pseudoflavonifractor sp.]
MIRLITPGSDGPVCQPCLRERKVFLGHIPYGFVKYKKVVNFVIYIIGGLFLMLLFPFMFFYTQDTGCYWNDPPGGVKLEPPSVYNLEDRNIDNINRYVKRIVCPYYYYLDKAEKIKEADDSSGLLLLIVGAFPGLFVFSAGLGKLDFIKPMTAAFFVSVLAQIVVYFVENRIYEKKFKLEEFKVEYEKYKDICNYFEENKSEYGETREAAIKRETLGKYIEYLARNMRKIEKRIFAKKCFTYVCGFLYLAILFFGAAEY